MQLNVEIEIAIRNKKKELISFDKYKCNTFVKNFLFLLNSVFRMTAVSVTDTSGVSQSASAKSAAAGGAGGWNVLAGSDDDSFGIVVGTSTTPVTADDYNLGAKIAHGTGAGQLGYSAVTVYEPQIDGNTVRQWIQRTFTNNSGADITINEIGLIVKTSVDNFLVMIIRDVIGATTIPAGGTGDLSIFLEVTA